MTEKIKIEVDTITRRIEEASKKPRVRRRIMWVTVVTVLINLLVLGFGPYFLTKPSQTTAALGTKTKTVEFYVGQNFSTTGIASGTTATYDFSVYLPDAITSETVVRSAFVEYNTVTSAASGTVSTYQLGPVGGLTTLSSPQTHYQSGESIPIKRRLDATTKMQEVVQAPGTYSLRFTTLLTGPVRYGENAKLYVTYDYNADAPTQIKTVYSWVHSQQAAVASGGSATSDTFNLGLPESGITSQSTWVETRGYVNAALTTGFKWNAETQRNIAWPNTVNSYGYVALVSPTTTYSPNSNNTFTITSVSGAFSAPSAVIGYTYSFNYSTSTELMNSIKVLLDQSTATASTATLSGNRVINIPESGVTLKSSFLKGRAVDAASVAVNLGINAQLGSTPTTSAISFNTNAAEISGFKEYIWNTTSNLSGMTTGDNTVYWAHSASGSTNIRSTYLYLSYKYTKSTSTNFNMQAEYFVGQQTATSTTWSQAFTPVIAESTYTLKQSYLSAQYNLNTTSAPSYTVGISTTAAHTFLASGEANMGEVWKDTSANVTTLGSSLTATLNTSTTATKSASFLVQWQSGSTEAIYVSQAGSQNATLPVPGTAQHIGGAFTFVEDTTTRTVTSIKLTEVGTVNANLYISNVRIYYKEEATCSVTIPSGTTLFNSTGASFNTNQEATLTGTMSVGTSQVCAYVVVDIGSTGTDGRTLDIVIQDPSVDVVATATAVLPESIRNITGFSTLTSPLSPNTNLLHYRWRNDDGGQPRSRTGQATGNEVVSTGWTNPADAYTLNSTYATAAPAKNNSVSSNFTGFGLDSLIADGATIDAVNIGAVYRVNTDLSIASLQTVPVVSGSDCGTGQTDTQEPTTDTEISQDHIGCRSWTKDDLLDANFKVRVAAIRGNSGTVVTFYLDYVYVTVDYSVTSATNKQNEDTPHTGQATLENIRLRTTVVNNGGIINQGYKLEYGQKVTDCSSIASWTPVPTTATTEDFEIVDSSYFDTQDETRNTVGLLSDPSPGYFIPGRLVEDPDVATNNIKLGLNDFTEIEHAIEAKASASGNYCFRLVNGGGSALSTYSVYPEITFGSANQNPNEPVSLTQKTSPGDVAISESAWTNDNTPNLGFSITDPDGDTVKYRIQIDGTSSSFSNLVLDYTHSSLSASGTTFAFTVGQSGGIYTVGSEGMTLADSASGYWWRVQSVDAYDAFSNFVEHGVAGTMDFRVDATAPTGGTVNDGQLVGGDLDWNTDGSLNQYLANWTATPPDASVSGLLGYEYTIRRASDDFYWTPGSPGSWGAGEYWFNNGTNTSFTVNNLNLETGTLYYVSLRTTDNAGNSDAINSNGLRVTPNLSYSISSNVVNFDDLNNANNWTDTKNTTITTSTNASGGYTVKGYTSDYLRSLSNVAQYIIDFAGTWLSPAIWNGFCKDNSAFCGFGYTSNDTSVQGSNRFGSGSLFSRYTQTSPGEVVADHTNAVNGQTGAILNEQFTISHKVSVDPSQAASAYQTILYLTVTANY